MVDAVGVVAGAAGHDRENTLVGAEITQLTARPADVIIIVITGDGASGFYKVHGIVQVRTACGRAGVHQDIVPEVARIQVTRTVKGIGLIAATHRASREIDRVVVEVVSSRCPGLVNAENFGLRTASQADDIITVGGGACVNLDAIDFGRDAVAPRYRQTIYKIAADRAGGSGSVIVDPDHPSLEIRIAVGQIVHRVAAYRLPDRHGAGHDDARYRC